MFMTLENTYKKQGNRATALLCPVMFGNVYDYSMGYGGRLLGVTSSNMRYSYTGIDPNTETIEGLNYLNTLLDNPGTLVQSVSEEYQPTDVDLAFSSPPYFNLEKYSEEDTQCQHQTCRSSELILTSSSTCMQNRHVDSILTPPRRELTLVLFVF